MLLVDFRKEVGRRFLKGFKFDVVNLPAIEISEVEFGFFFLIFWTHFNDSTIWLRFLAMDGQIILKEAFILGEEKEWKY